jgi:integrase
MSGSFEATGQTSMVQVLREGPVRITKAAVDAAWRRRAPGTRLVIGDVVCRGLALVVNPSTMTWTFSYKPRGLDSATGKRFPSRSVTIGNPETHSPDDARAEANRLKGAAAAGEDPAGEKKAKVAAAAAKRSTTLSRLLDAYAAALPSRPKLRGAGTISARTAKEEETHSRAAVAAMKAGDRSPSDIGAADLRAMLQASLGKSARSRFGAISRFFDWCQDEGHVALNPCLLVAKSRRPRAPAPREHYLALPDLARLWRAADTAPDMEPVNRDLARFLIAVPCRRNEGTRLRWEHLDLASATWKQPGKMTKNRDLHRLHLHPLALGILTARWEASGKPKVGLVFPAPRSGKAIDTFTDMKAALAKATGLTDWWWHDVRRSFSTTLGEAGIPEPVADAVLNHRQSATRGGVLGTYQRAQRWPEQVKAMKLWGEMLAAALEGKEHGAEVVELRPTKAPT